MPPPFQTTTQLHSTVITLASSGIVASLSTYFKSMPPQYLCMRTKMTGKITTVTTFSMMRLHADMVKTKSAGQKRRCRCCFLPRSAHGQTLRTRQEGSDRYRYTPNYSPNPAYIAVLTDTMILSPLLSSFFSWPTRYEFISLLFHRKYSCTVDADGSGQDHRIL